MSSSSCACVGLHPSCMHNPEGKHSCMCTEKPETRSSLETSERQQDYSGICLRCSLYVIFKMIYMEIKWSILKILNMENDWRNNNWRSTKEKIVLNTYIGRVLIFSQSIWRRIMLSGRRRRNCSALELFGLSSWRRSSLL